MKSIIVCISLAFISFCAEAQDCGSKETKSGVAITTSLEKVGGTRDGNGTVNYSFLQFARLQDTYMMEINAEVREHRIIENEELVELVFDDNSKLKVYTTGRSSLESKQGKAFTQGSAVSIYSNHSSIFLTKEQMKSLVFKKLVMIHYGDLRYVIDKPQVVKPDAGLRI